jgi:hypothetical protein
MINARAMRRGVMIAGLSCLSVAISRGQEPQEPLATQFVVEIDYGQARLYGRDLDYAFIDPVGGLSGGGEVQNLDFDAHELPAFGIGWKLPGAKQRWLDVQFSRWEGRDTADTGTRPGQVGALWASPDFAIGRSLVDRASAVATNRAGSYSVRLAWQLGQAGGPEIRLAGGVRAVRFEEESLITYRAERSGQRLQEVVSHRQDVRGWGPDVTISWSDQFGRRVRLGASGEAAILIGRIDLDASDQAFIDGSFDRATIATRDDQRQDLMLLGAALTLDVMITRHFSLGAGYRYERWSGVSERVQFLDDVSQNSATISEGRATIAGPSLRLRCLW